jgi:cephalosporin-C deacetylase-like acetyl esterase
VLLPFAPDWRWLLGQEDNPWYPSVKLFRQEKKDDWSSVLEKIKVEILSYFDAVDLAYRTRINALTKKSEKFSPRLSTSPKAIDFQER